MVSSVRYARLTPRLALSKFVKAKTLIRKCTPTNYKIVGKHNNLLDLLMSETPKPRICYSPRLGFCSGFSGAADAGSSLDCIMKGSCFRHVTIEHWADADAAACSFN